MARIRKKVRLGWIRDDKTRKASLKRRLTGIIKKVNQLSILCDMRAAVVVFNREEDHLAVWPSPEAAKSLIDDFYGLTDHERTMKAVDPDSYVQTNIEKIEKKLADTRKVITEFEMEHLMFQLQNGRELADLSPTEVDKLISYSDKKLMCLSKQMGVHEADLGAEYLRASNVASGSGGNGFNMMETGRSFYYVDKWVFVDPQVQTPCDDETHLPTMVTGLDLNMEPSDDVDEDLGTYKGESSKAGGAEDDSE
ncbi:Transcription factor MADS-box [Arabidopsis thaliana x Arabidopsis arenosa]|uniref:Transcription factor MADS-box n=2 Tax=Arabidopsis TaxID=3701 RepID=A0A8T1Z5I6_ARASU|nr:Transcription factor MADS-box [Arabidopsis thaliana x Arabidopsis arenosa]KAG7554335.1 Transcription factor MADS-box [Arabidopsis suecica]